MFEAIFWNSEHVFDKAETLSREILFFGHLLTIARFDLGTRLKGETVTNIPAGICFLKVNNRNTRKRCEICSKLTIKTLKRRHWRRSGVFIVNFKHVNADWDIT